MSAVMAYHTSPSSSSAPEDHPDQHDEPTRAELRALAAEANASLAAADRVLAELKRLNDPFAAWVADVCRQGDVPSRAESLALARSGTDHDRAELVRRNLPFAISVVQQYAPDDCSMDLRMRLVSAANLGMTEAAARYNPAHSSGATFTTYAYWWLRKRIVEEFVDERAHAAISLSGPSLQGNRAVVLVAPPLVLPDPPLYGLHPRSRDARAVIGLLAFDLDVETAAVLVLRTGALVPGLRYAGWTPPDDWFPGITWSHRRIAAALECSVRRVRTRLVRLKALLLEAARASPGSPEAARLLDFLDTLDKPPSRPRSRRRVTPSGAALDGTRTIRYTG